MQDARRYGFLALFLALAACAGGGTQEAVAPQPAKPIDAARFYTGTWYEIARTPMKLTDGCVAGTTAYLPGSNGQVIERDACQMGTPAGKEKEIQGPVDFLNPGQNTKVAVHYTVYWIIPITRTYWMLDRGTDYRWFIMSNPALTQISVFTRSPRPDPGTVADLTARVQALGYDSKKLEYPTEFPASQVP